ncbi:MAG TPA: DUF3093 domain-containing protein [Mycobacteriales bacterium]|nr:DUF3093 domain-containing protein [Mycobacteriales bacterium]
MPVRTAVYEERLRVPWWWWPVAAALVATLGVAIGHPLGAAAGVVTSVLVFGLVAGLIAAYGTVRVAVESGMLVAGRARMPVSAVGRVDALDAADTRDLLGPHADPAAYVLSRPYVPTAVRVEVTDPADPTPYWLVTTRRPDELASALRTAAGV